MSFPSSPSNAEFRSAPATNRTCGGCVKAWSCSMNGSVLTAWRGPASTVVRAFTLSALSLLCGGIAVGLEPQPAATVQTTDELHIPPAPAPERNDRPDGDRAIAAPPAEDPFKQTARETSIDPLKEFAPIGSLTTEFRVRTTYVPDDAATAAAAAAGTIVAPPEPLKGGLAPTPYGVIDGFCHQPLYFEQPGFERYGQSYGDCLDPFISAGQFFLTIPTLPYQITVKPPCSVECPVCREQHCRQRHLRDLDPAGVAVEAAVIVGLIFLIP